MIAVEKLSYSYKGAKSFALDNLNFSIESGEIFGFLGPSGAGKSTTQKILYKILTDYQGEVLIDGVSLDTLGKDYYTRIGVGFELPNHYMKLTARENLTLFGSFYPEEKLQKLETLFEAVGMEEHIDKRVEDYSKGMKMRLNFIRSIMHNPDIIFFDEPTSGLDPINAHKVKEQIKNLKAQGKTIFITTHDMTTADELCDRVSFIVDGKIVLTDTPSNLKHIHGKECIQVTMNNWEKTEFPVKNIGHNQMFLELIKREDLMKIETLEATLEEVFIKVTGTSLKI
ncbi:MULTISPECIES: ABC transporter ATP-binding protein [unclassified Aureispira]|uniref:ABC transporter ATP-binding protein n=1 Tax=unclassified Aureispira TaxID=2649989 RepID=UPI000696999E|nr:MULTISPECIES: ABC transporter ATP-binding protein [unclassified Aureispira]WMX12256.1 ABC transporter ATP-binding protein [Aureispira sp. CCB-E]